MELIKIYQGNIIDAKELYAFLKVNTKFTTWIQRMLDYGFEEGKEFFPILGKTSQKGGRPPKDYFLTIGTAKEIAMLQRSEKGREARKYFIKAEETLIKLANNKRLEAFLKLEATKEKLLNAIKGIGGTHADYIQIDTTGRAVFFNGTPLPDEEMATLLIKGRDFATEMTNINLKQDKYTLKEVEDLNKLHHKGVRKSIIEGIGQTPESLPKEENIKGPDKGNDKLKQ